MVDVAVPRLVLVVAMGRNRAIGREGALPWRLPSDLRRFRARTMGRPLLMGRKTFDSIGRPLPGRETIVLTRDSSFRPAGVLTAPSVDVARSLVAERAAAMGVDEAIVAGGGGVYAALLPFATEIDLTEVDLAPAGDAFFPALDPAAWREISSTPFAAGEGDDAACVLRVLRRT